MYGIARELVDVEFSLVVVAEARLREHCALLL